MKTSEQIGELVKALALARAKFGVIGKDKRADVRSDKGSFSYTYADLASALDATAPALAEQGLAVMQPTRSENGQIIVTTLLAHLSGQWVSEEMAWPAGNDTRARGSAVTYARRHGYLSIIGAAAQDDDDAAAADNRPPRREKTQRRETQPSEAAKAVRERMVVPKNPGERMANLRTRLSSMHVAGASHFEQIAEWIGHVVDSKTQLTADEWTLCDTAIDQARDAGETLGRVQDNAARSEH